MMMNKKYIRFSFIKQKIKTVLLVVLMVVCGTKLFAQTTDEYTMKAIAFEKLALFITWPANSLKNNHSQEFVIAVLGQNPFGDVLENIYKNKKIKDKKVKIVYVKKLQQLPECQILFISKTDSEKLQKILDYLKGKPILTISDTEGFAQAGCFINYYLNEDKLRFEINQKALQNAGFTIDYRLLRVSKIINPTSE